MPPSEELIIWHRKHCPDLDINSIDFTNYLISEISKLKKEIKLDS